MLTSIFRPAMLSAILAPFAAHPIPRVVSAAHFDYYEYRGADAAQPCFTLVSFPIDAWRDSVPAAPACVGVQLPRRVEN